MATKREQEHRPLRICMVTDCYPPSIGGIENHVYALSRELGRLGHAVTLVTHKEVKPHGVRPVPPVVVPPGVELVRLHGFTPRLYGSDPALGLSMPGQFARLLESQEFDVAHGHTMGSALVVALMLEAARHGLPTVITKHSMITRPGRPRSITNLLCWGMTRLANHFTAHIAVSEAAAEELGGTQSKVFVIYNAIDTGLFRPDTGLRQETRSRLKFGEQDVVVGFMSRFVASKGILELVDISARLAEQVPNVRFLLVGDGPLRSRVERHIHQLGLKERFRLVGFQPWGRTPSYLNAMDVFAFPSHSEGFGLALMEAMACGLSAVTTDQSGTQDVLVHGETAFTADSLDAFAEDLLCLVSDAALRAQMGERARQAVEHALGWNTVARRTVEVYREAIALQAETSL
jgi:glycosyltransferase involved in cell wall biosynthesis